LTSLALLCLRLDLRTGCCTAVSMFVTPARAAECNGQGGQSAHTDRPTARQDPPGSMHAFVVAREPERGARDRTWER